MRMHAAATELQAGVMWTCQQCFAINFCGTRGEWQKCGSNLSNENNSYKRTGNSTLSPLNCFIKSELSSDLCSLCSWISVYAQCLCSIWFFFYKLQNLLNAYRLCNAQSHLWALKPTEDTHREQQQHILHLSAHSWFPLIFPNRVFGKCSTRLLPLWPSFTTLPQADFKAFSYWWGEKIVVTQITQLQ